RCRGNIRRISEFKVDLAPTHGYISFEEQMPIVKIVVAVVFQPHCESVSLDGKPLKVMPLTLPEDGLAHYFCTIAENAVAGDFDVPNAEGRIQFDVIYDGSFLSLPFHRRLNVRFKISPVKQVAFKNVGRQFGLSIRQQYRFRSKLLSNPGAQSLGLRSRHIIDPNTGPRAEYCSVRFGRDHFLQFRLQRFAFSYVAMRMKYNVGACIKTLPLGQELICCA